MLSVKAIWNGGREGCFFAAKMFLLIVLVACSPREAKLPRLKDTGITWGGDYPKGNHSDCRGNIVASDESMAQSRLRNIVKYQDCSQGLDAASKHGGGSFRYVLLDYQGQVLDANSAKRAYCALDEISGLLWELKMPADGIAGNQGMHDSDDLYTWYNSNSKLNGGSIGDWNSAMAQCTGYLEGQPTTYCNTEEYLNRINRQGLCAYRDWRLPSRIELETLVNYGRTEPAIDTRFFPNTQNKFYWSASPFAQQNKTAWAVNFQFGYSATLQHNNARAIRLVRQGRKH